MESNNTLLMLGTFKKWQIYNYLMLCFSVMVIPSMHTIAIVYIGYKPEHHCTIPLGSTLEESIPLENGKFSSCLMYKNFTLNNEVTACTNGWTYSKEHGDTIVTKWDLVCDKGYLAQTPQTTFIAGSIAGCLFFSDLSDTFGRKPVFFFCQLLTLIFGLVSAFIPNFIAFCVVRFFHGIFVFSIMSVGFILTCELYAAPHRTFVGTIIENFWALGLAIVPFLAFLLRDWVYLEIVVSLLSIIVLPFYWLLPESVLWLEVTGRTHEAEKVLQRAARINKITLPSPIFKTATENAKCQQQKSTFSSMVHSFKNFFKKTEMGDKKEKLIERKQLVYNRTIRKHLILVSFLWLSVTMVYTAFLFTTAQLAGNHYLNGFLSSLVEVPAYLVSYFVMIRFGRKISLISFQLVAGVALILQLIASKMEFGGGMDMTIWVVVFNMIGKLGISGAYGSLDLFAPELFPTSLRNLAHGVASVFGRAGTIASTFMPYILEKNDWIPLLVLALFVAIACVLVGLLPETIHRKLPHTIEEIEGWYEKKNSGDDEDGAGGKDGKGDGICDDKDDGDCGEKDYERGEDNKGFEKINFDVEDAGF